jgi:1,4-dihydroxy-2-naphthoate polyprenyltransferase
VRDRLAAFVRLSRSRFLAGGATGVGLGTAVAAYVANAPVDWHAWSTAQFTVSALQLMTHYSNEYFDRFADARAIRTDFSGGSGILVDGTLAPPVALVAAIASLGLGLVGTAMLTVEGHGIAALFAAAIALLAWSYSAPPLRLLARGLGELDTTLIVAVLVPLCAYAAQNRPFTALALAATLPGAAAMFAMMLAVELPDIECDALGGKRNLLVRAGRSAIVPLGQAALVVVYAGVMVAFGTGAPLSVVILGAVTIPAALGLGAAFARVAEGASDATSAARGVAFFFLVSASGLLGYLVPLPWRI